LFVTIFIVMSASAVDIGEGDWGALDAATASLVLTCCDASFVYAMRFICSLG
jgi:hypothetical protein